MEFSPKIERSECASRLGQMLRRRTQSERAVFQNRQNGLMGQLQQKPAFVAGEFVLFSCARAGSPARNCGRFFR
jgi:hypothetical protein